MSDSKPRPVLKTHIASVMSLMTGKRAECEVYRCDVCDHPFFGIFKLLEQEHLHLQCAKCGMSYCPEGLCEAPPAAQGGPST